MERDDVVAVEMKRHGVGERDDRQRRHRVRRDIALDVLVELQHRHALAHVVVREDDRAFFRHVRVAADVIAVHVRVEHEADRLVGNRADRREYFRRERRELGVDHHDAVVARGDADVAALAFQHVERSGELGRLDHRGVEIALLGVGGKAQRRKQCDNYPFHHFLPGVQVISACTAQTRSRPSRQTSRSCGTCPIPRRTRAGVSPQSPVRASCLSSPWPRRARRPC